MNVLITGGAGNLGRCIAAELREHLDLLLGRDQRALPHVADAPEHADAHVPHLAPPFLPGAPDVRAHRSKRMPHGVEDRAPVFGREA